MKSFEWSTLQKLEQLEAQLLGILKTVGELRGEVLARVTPVETPVSDPAPVTSHVPEPITAPLEENPVEPKTPPVDLSTLNVTFRPAFSTLPVVNIEEWVSSFDREQIIHRCRFKAKCIDTVNNPYRLDCDIAALHAEGKDHYGGVYWMLHFPNFERFNEAALPDTAHAYRNLALALELVEDDQEDYNTLLLVAEAQSALRVAVSTALSNWKDNEDQHATFDWLHDVTRKRHIYLERFMKITDTADPANGADLEKRLKIASRIHLNDGNKDRSIRKLWGKLDYELKKLPDDASRWENVSRLVGELLDANVPASRLEFRERLEAWIDTEHPETEPLLKVFSAIATYQEQVAEETESTERTRWSADVLKVQSWLQNSRVVLIGGDCRVYTKQKLEEAFGLAELCWPVLEPHDRIEKAYPLIDLPGVRVCLLAIRLSSHSYGPDLATYCSERNIPLVRLKAGLNPNRVAVEIIRQASNRLFSVAVV